MPTTLAMRVAQLQRRVAAYITSIATAQIQRAWNQLEWDENQHPRGPNGRFIGGSGLRAEREAYHLGHALKGFERQHEHSSPEERKAAADRLTWRGHTGLKAIQAHLGELRHQAQDGVHALAPHDLALLQHLRQVYLERTVQANIPTATQKRIGREIAVIDRYLKQHDGPLPTPAISKAEDALIRQQVAEGIAKEAQMQPPKIQGATPAQNLVTSVPQTPTIAGMPRTTSPAPGLTPLTDADLAAMREKGGGTPILAREWPRFWRMVQGNPRSKIGDGAILAPAPLLNRKDAMAEMARRNSDPLYKALMETGEVTFQAKDGESLTVRRRWHLGSQKALYELFSGDNREPYPAFTKSMVNAQSVYDFLEQVT